VHHEVQEGHEPRGGQVRAEYTLALTARDELLDARGGALVQLPHPLGAELRLGGGGE